MSLSTSLGAEIDLLQFLQLAAMPMLALPALY